MKTILCFGDSNTYGYNPLNGSRYGIHERWPGILRDELGDQYWIIEEGQPGRTSVWNDPIEGIKSGKDYLPPCLESHAPVDLVILLLGTNDLKARFSLTPTDIALGAQTLIKIIQNSQSGPNHTAPRILLVAPPPVIAIPDLWEPMYLAPEKSKYLGQEYQKIAIETGCHFLDSGSVIHSSQVDGFHWDIEEHCKLGQAISVLIYKILSEG